MTLSRIKENLEFKNKMPVNFLTDWHYILMVLFYCLKLNNQVQITSQRELTLRL